jgi:DNA mismatch repair protein MSH4
MSPMPDSSSHFSVSRSKPSASRSVRPSTQASSSKYTQATTRPTTSSRPDSVVILALVEGRGSASEVGIAALDLRTSECHISQVIVCV